MGNIGGNYSTYLSSGEASTITSEVLGTTIYARCSHHRESSRDNKE